MAEADSNGNVLVNYGYQPDSIWGTDPLYMSVNGAYHFYLNDHLGTPQQLAAKNGAQSWAAVTEAFGKTTVLSSLVNNDLRFPGQYEDSEIGYHYNFNRSYDYAVARYNKADPVGVFGGDNSFRYGNNNPNIYIDSNGLWVLQAIGAASGAIGAIVSNYDLYKCGKISGWKFAGLIFSGAASGALTAGLPLKFGVYASVVGTFMEQIITQNLAGPLDYGKGILSVLGGAVSGKLARFLPGKKRIKFHLDGTTSKVHVDQRLFERGSEAIAGVSSGVIQNKLDGNQCGCTK